MKKRGFTLIELLVVIAIVAIVAAILFPVFVNAKERGRMTKCLSNLKNLASAFRLYADSNNGRLPSVHITWCAPAWYTDAGGTHSPICNLDKGALWPYTGRNKGIFLCPTDRYMAATQITGSPRNFPLSYSMNIYLGTIKSVTLGACPPYSLTARNRDRIAVDSIRSQSRVLLIIHEGRDNIDDGCFRWDSTAGSGGTLINLPSKVHWNGTTLAYLDGHAVWRSYNQLVRERDDPSKPWDPDPTFP